MLEDIKSVAILGHVRPDGDCPGPTLGLYNYLRLDHPDIRAAVHLEESSLRFSCLKGYDKIRHRVDNACYELCACPDSGDVQRPGDFKHYLDRTDKSLCLDHHTTNACYGSTSVVPDKASSTCEVPFDQLGEEKADRHTAECLYTGIVHDTGVFEFSCTSARTIEIAGKLMEKGIDFGAIMDNSFYRKTCIQNQILDRTPLESIAFFDGWCIFSAIRQSEMEFYEVDGKDLDGTVDQPRLTEGVEVATFIYETGAQELKVSIHSRYLVDVSRIAAFFGGGGHVRATGYIVNGNIHGIINSLSVYTTEQLDVVPDGQK